MKVLNEPLMSYVKRQQALDYFYIEKIVSKNALSALVDNNVNELVADVNVLDSSITDKDLLQKVKEVLRYGNNGSTK